MCGAKLPAMKHINWSSVDWRKPVRQIAKELGCSRQAVYLAQARRWNELEKAAKQTAPRRRNRTALMNPAF
jgi:hypothetical protein